MKDLKKTDFQQLFDDNKEYIYSILLYVAGLLIGTFTYTGVQSEKINKRIASIFQYSAKMDLLQLFINRFAIYIIIFCITVLMGLLVIGYAVTNTVPIITGCIIGLRISYYYVNYGIKGVGYCALLVIPEAALFMAIIVYCIKIGNQLSRGIMDSIKKQDTAVPYQAKPYLKSYLIYLFSLSIAAFLNALLTYLLTPLIKL